MIGRICGTGSCVPRHVLTNDDLSEMVDTNDAWIRERTGIARRHIVEEETVVSMASEAAKRALEDAGTDASEIDLLIVSTFTSEVLLPSAACEVQREIGAEHAVCFDLNAACAGFLFAYNTAQAYIEAGMCRTALLIGAESLSNMVNWKDRGTCILFGDGAGACIVKAEEGEFSLPAAHSDGRKGGALTLLSRHRKETQKMQFDSLKVSVSDAQEGGQTDPQSYIQMDGREVFKFAITKVPEVIEEALRNAEVTAEEIDLFVLHQANRRIVEAVAKRLKTGIQKFPMNLQAYGNTSSASIPLLLDELNRKGILKRGQTVVMAGFGAGLSWGAVVIKW